MRNIIAIFTGLGLVLAAFAGLALAIVLGTVATGAILLARLTGRMKPAAANASASAAGKRSKSEFRIWNDGRGTIIDM